MYFLLNIFLVGVSFVVITTVRIVAVFYLTNDMTFRLWFYFFV